MNRRSLLQLVIGGGLLGWSGYLIKALYWPSQLDRNELATLDAFLDTLVPADETPGALDLGIHEVMAVRIAKDREYRYLVRVGNTWLNTQARAFSKDDFPACDVEERVRIVKNAEDSGPDSPAFVFFTRLRMDCFKLYYADPRTWPGLGFAGPPQPIGFPLHDQPPQA